MKENRRKQHHTQVRYKRHYGVYTDVQAHSAKADQNPYVLRTAGLLKMCLNAALNQIAFVTLWK